MIMTNSANFKSSPELIVALDMDSLETALAMVDSIGEAVGWYKVGSQLFCNAGPVAVFKLKEKGKKVFLDLKFHDIPNTVAKAANASSKLGVDMLNVHAGGGKEMMEAAAKAVHQNAGKGLKAPIIVAVTVLTSMDESAFAKTLNRKDGYSPADHVAHLASLAKQSGMDGVVASAHEIDIVKNSCGDDFMLVVPGIRPSGSGDDDQKRIMTPAEAVRKGANYIVVGRPILEAESPAKAALAIKQEMVHPASA